MEPSTIILVLVAKMMYLYTDYLSFDDSATVLEFAKRWNVLTVEIEHVDVATMEMLEQQGVECQPRASTI
nr:phosphoribosylaminoimidazole carboxylase, chloroplastic [Quercus suber]